MKRSKVAAAAVAVCLLDACGSAPGGPGSSHPSTDDPGPLIRIEKDSEYSMEALLTGRMELEHGCLVLANRLGKGLLVWPASARWDPDARTVNAADGSIAIPIGGHLSQGGGWYQDPQEIGLRLSPESYGRLRECAQATGVREVAKIEPLAAD